MEIRPLTVPCFARSLSELSTPLVLINPYPLFGHPQAEGKRQVPLLVPALGPGA
jgi:hypothetical protein